MSTDVIVTVPTKGCGTHQKTDGLAAHNLWGWVCASRALGHGVVVSELPRDSQLQGLEAHARTRLKNRNRRGNAMS